MIIGYRDYVKDGAIIDTVNVFLPSMPASRLQDRRLAVKARMDGSESCTLQIDFVGFVPVGIVALLAHNMNGVGQTFVEGQYFDGGTWQPVFTFTEAPWQPADNSLFPRHHIVVLPENYLVERLIYNNTGSSTVDSESWTAGRLWAGPVWRPRYKTSMRDFRVAPIDPGVLSKSKGQQAYADELQRFRRLHAAIPAMTESEAIGTDDGETPNLQDLGFEVGKTSPIIVIPTESSNQAIHKFGLYGTFVDPPPVDLLDGNAALGRLYTTVFDVDEEL